MGTHYKHFVETLLMNTHMFSWKSKTKIRAQLFKTNDVVSLCIVKTLIIKYGIYADIFAEKM